MGAPNIEAMPAVPSMSLKATESTGELPNPWCTIQQAADYYQISDDSIERMMIGGQPERRIDGKIRFGIFKITETGRLMIRLWSPDVKAVLPPLE